MYLKKVKLIAIPSSRKDAFPLKGEGHDLYIIPIIPRISGESSDLHQTMKAVVDHSIAYSDFGSGEFDNDRLSLLWIIPFQNIRWIYQHAVDFIDLNEKSIFDQQLVQEILDNDGICEVEVEENGSPKWYDDGKAIIHMEKEYLNPNYKEINGDLISLAQEGAFDVITHGCNCFNLMGSGIAPQMAKAFGCDQSRGLFKLEQNEFKGSILKLGTIEYHPINIGPGKTVMVVNSYTQYHYGMSQRNLDYEALTLCLRKINHEFDGQHIGLPQIGCGLAGGDWNVVKGIIQEELKDCNVTVVIYNKK
jgi:O-acetyl-ADP-ribose deacetylase (regulator of RNase III)